MVDVYKSNQPIVMIEWIDVQSNDLGLFEIKDLRSIRPVKAYIVGFLVKETANSYYIVKERWESNQFKYLHVIPKVSVLNLLELCSIEDIKERLGALKIWAYKGAVSDKKIKKSELLSELRIIIEETFKGLNLLGMEIKK